MRLSNVPMSDLRDILGLTDDCFVPGANWLRVVTWTVVRDALGRPVNDCVFADTETGLVVIRDTGIGRYPLRCENRPAPLTVEGMPP